MSQEVAHPDFLAGNFDGCARRNFSIIHSNQTLGALLQVLARILLLCIRG
jgi:hypothetical protein